MNPNRYLKRLYTLPVKATSYSYFLVTAQANRTTFGNYINRMLCASRLLDAHTHTHLVIIRRLHQFQFH